MTELLLQSLYSGVLAGGHYALIAIGLALVFGTMKIINLAHGEFVLLAAYLAYTFESALQLSPLLAIPLALAVVAAVAAIVFLLLDRIKMDRELNSLILTYGVGIVLTNAILQIWGADIHTTASNWLQEGFSLGPLISTRGDVLAFALSMALLAGLWWWLTKTWHGKAVRAASLNREVAMLTGVNPRSTELISFAVAGVLASFAGIAIYCVGIIQPPLGVSLTVKAFVISVLAGLGSMPGIFVAAVLLGVVEALTVTYLGSALQELAGMVLFLAVLFVLPSGLFGKSVRRG